jgi:hypothetical protein
MNQLKWPFVDFLDALFRALIENELEVLRFGYPTQTWSERIRQMPVPDIHREGGGGGKGGEVIT